MTGPAHAELAEVIGRIRAQPGFERFRAQLPFAEIARIVCAGGRPVVHLAVTAHGGMALVVTGRAVTHLPLPGLTHLDAFERITRHHRAYSDFRADPRTGYRRWSDSLDELGRWAWDRVMGPLLDALPEIPAAVVIAGGMLSSVAWHAAWTPDPETPTGRRYAADSIRLSYAPSIRAWGTALAAAGRHCGDAVLVVSEPQPTRLPQLPAAAAEATAVLSSFPPDRRLHLRAGQATAGNVLAALQHADVLHAACHGQADPDFPLRSGVFLAADRPLRLEQLMAARTHLRLAVLSACESSVPGRAAPDEVLALPTGLLQAGAAGVIASLWLVADLASALVMSEFYARWTAAGGDGDPGAALAGAQAGLRDSTAAQLRVRIGETAQSAPQLAEYVERRLRGVDPQRRPFASIESWAGFTHWGA